MTTTSTTSVKPSLHHVTMKTSRLDEMIEWYGLVLGTRPNARAMDSVPCHSNLILGPRICGLRSCRDVC